GRTLPAGREGEIYVRGPTLFAHYYRHSPAECFDAEGFFHTGDLGQLDERGALHFRGRLKDVIKTAGVNVAAAEVEAALLAHPAVGAHEERVGDARGVVALGGEGELPLLQRAGHVHLGHQADEGGASVGRQVPLGARVQRRAVEARAPGEHEGRHARAAVLARHLHAVHVRLRDPGRSAEDVGDLLRGDVLALPAEGVADAIDEVVVAVGVLAQQVPGAEPGIAAREGVVHELPLARRAVGVAVVLHGAADASEELARLARPAGDAEAVGAAHEL